MKAKRFAQAPRPVATRAFAAAALLALAAPAALAPPAEPSRRKPRGHADFPPLAAAAPAPENYPTTPEKVALGKQLFFDPRLSGDNTRSCASCHLPAKGFADGLAKTPGLSGKPLPRNTPSTLNAGFWRALTWDGRAASLEAQALDPIQNPEEMNQDLAELERELAAVPRYAASFRAVFGEEGVTRAHVAQALAAFERTLATGPTPVDRFLAGESEALSPAARRGYELFVGEADCARCHRGPLFSDEKFHRLGLSSADRGRGAVTGEASDEGRFRTPSLRNVARTAPYMHDGSQPTLAAVVEFYYRGAPGRDSRGAPFDVQPLLGQSFSETADLVAFLEALTGEAPEVTPPELP